MEDWREGIVLQDEDLFLAFVYTFLAFLFLV